MNLTIKLFHSDHPAAMDEDVITIYGTDFLRDSGEGADVRDQLLRCDGCKTLFDTVDGVLDHARFRAPKGCQCIPHATCGHRVRWTGVIDDGELIPGTGCWVHIEDRHGNLQKPRVR